ncbi:MAG: tetratricopeptide repeat protein [Bacteroidetes bacterium]|nr:tetratricopeptide repeat protein [Bacteroidota bacterium]
MKISGAIFFLGLFAPLLSFSQNDQAAGASKVVMVVGRPMTYDDSMSVKRLFFSAMSEKTIENFPRAADYFNQVLQIDPRNDASMYQLASIKRVQNDYASAQDLLEKAVTVNPDNQWYWVALSDCYEKSNQLDKLENVFNELLRIDPGQPDYYFDLANVYFIEKKYGSALAVYDKLIPLTGLTDDIVAKRESIYLRQGKIDKAAADVQDLINNNPSQVRYYLLLAELYNSNGMPDKALPVLQSAEKVAPDNGQVHLALADLYRDKKDNENCYDQLTQAFALPDMDVEQGIKIIMGYVPKFPDPNAKASALELSRLLTVSHPDDARAYALYGDVLLQNEKYADARVSYKKSIALNGQVYEVQEQLVRLDLGANDLDQAIKDGENALSLFPNQAWLNYLVGVAWQQKKNYKKAIGLISNATLLETQDKDLLSQCYSSLGDCYHSTGDNAKSDESYSTSLTYNPDNPYTLNNYAYYLSVRGVSLDKAAAMSKHSNELQPNTASFEDTYAWILFKQKDYQDAKTWMEKAIADDKTHSAVQAEHYGDILYFTGNADGAVKSWQKAKEYGSDSTTLDKKIHGKKYVE